MREINWHIEKTSPADIEVLPLIEMLSAELFRRFGSSGKDSFQDWDFANPKYIFLKAVSDKETVGCGAIRPLSEKIAEIKRMFAKYPRKNIGRAILQKLEENAQKLGFEEIWLETRADNEEACRFYQKNGYRKIENYGKYIGRKDAVCFGKKLH